MPPGRKPPPRRSLTAGFILSALIALSLCFVLLPNPLFDRVLSRALGAWLGRSITLSGSRVSFPLNALGRRVDVRFETVHFEKRLFEPSSAVGRFLDENGLGDWRSFQDSRWVLVRKNGVVYARLLTCRSGDADLRGGLRLAGKRIQKMDLALRVPGGFLRRFVKIAEKRFASDRMGRRLVKLCWSRGRWTLWGRSGPMLEARWQ